MATHVFDFDDERITLGDGILNVESAIFGVEKVAGSRQCVRDPRLSHLADLPPIWKAPTQMVQVAPGHRWCSTCGDVRRLSYFEVTAWDERGKPTEWDEKTGQPTAWDGVPFPTKYAHECKQCVNMRDPKLRKWLDCSVCRQEKRREEFGDDERNATGKKSICLACQRLDEADRRRRKAAAEGRTMRPYVPLRA